MRRRGISQKSSIHRQSRVRTSEAKTREETSSSRFWPGGEPTPPNPDIEATSFSNDSRNIGEGQPLRGRNYRAQSVEAGRWVDATAPRTELEVQVHQRSAKHTVTVPQLQRWCDGVVTSPDAAKAKASKGVNWLR
jgi:hypothetical protein